MKKNTVYLQTSRQQGRTLLELMISITIGLVVLGAVSVVYLATTATSRQSLATSRMSEDAAIVMNILGNNLRMAGYSTPRTLVSSGGALVAGRKLTIPDRNFTDYAVRGCDFGFSSTVTTSTAFKDITCSTTEGLSAAFAVRYEGDVFNEDDPDADKKGSNTVPVKDTDTGKFIPSDCISVGIKKPDGYESSSYDPDITYPLVEARFSIATSDSNGTPELYCAGSGGTKAKNTRFKRQALMQFVENMVISYGIADDSISGNVVRYVTQRDIDGLTGTPEAHWSRVVNVKLCIVMRSDKPDKDGGGNYIDCKGDSVASANKYLRRAFTSVFTLRNRADFSDSL
jgi:type IV pilus assembly protein PilW